MILGARLPIPLWEREPDWDLESGIGLADKTARPIKNAYEARDASTPSMDPPPPPLTQRARYFMFH